jgi:hypothetical protein
MEIYGTPLVIPKKINKKNKDKENLNMNKNKKVKFNNEVFVKMF